MQLNIEGASSPRFPTAGSGQRRHRRHPSRKLMRAVFGCAVVSVMMLVAVGRVDGKIPSPDFGQEPTCEEQCRVVCERDNASCDTGALAERDRSFCRDAVRARLEVCLIICED
jgi:hypothetical protein